MLNLYFVGNFFRRILGKNGVQNVQQIGIFVRNNMFHNTLNETNDKHIKMWLTGFDNLLAKFLWIRVTIEFCGCPMVPRGETGWI